MGIFSPQGRDGRLLYMGLSYALLWLSLWSIFFYFGGFVIEFAAILPDMIMGGEDMDPSLMDSLIQNVSIMHYVVIWVNVLFRYLGMLTVIRRFHDTGHSGLWFLSLMIVPLIPQLYLMFSRGDDNDNEYGEPEWSRWWVFFIWILVGTIGIGWWGYVAFTSMINVWNDLVEMTDTMAQIWSGDIQSTTIQDDMQWQDMLWDDLVWGDSVWDETTTETWDDLFDLFAMMADVSSWAVESWSISDQSMTGQELWDDLSWDDMTETDDALTETWSVSTATSWSITATETTDGQTEMVQDSVMTWADALTWQQSDEPQEIVPLPALWSGVGIDPEASAEEQKLLGYLDKEPLFQREEEEEPEPQQTEQGEKSETTPLDSWSDTAEAASTWSTVATWTTQPDLAELDAAKEESTTVWTLDTEQKTLTDGGDLVYAGTREYIWWSFFTMDDVFFVHDTTQPVSIADPESFSVRDGIEASDKFFLYEWATIVGKNEASDLTAREKYMREARWQKIATTEGE